MVEIIGEDFPEANCVLLKSGHSDPICVRASVVVLFIKRLSVQLMLFRLFLSCKKQCLTL